MNATPGPRRFHRLAALSIVSALLVVFTSAAPGARAQPALNQIATVSDPEGLRLRAGPGTQYGALAVIPKGTELPILGEWQNGVWAPVSYQGKRGFINVAYVSIRPVSATSATAPPAAATPPRTATPAASPTSPAPATSDGVTLLRVTASDADDMITVGDSFALVATVRLPAGVNRVTMRLAGAAFLPFSGAYPISAGDNALSVPAFRVDTEWEPLLRESVIRKVGGTLPIRDGALELTLDFTMPSGARRTVEFQPAVVWEEDPDQPVRIQYPDLKRITGLPPQGAGRQNYYLRGDLDFHHPDDFNVRKFAIEAARRGGVFPDDPEQVADNIFRSINALLGDADPGDFNNDLNLAAMIEDGTIVRGQLNGGYICIAQSYLMTSLSRTLGLPSRELNIAVGRPSWLGYDGAWRVEWWQEAAVQTWYNGRWNHYDLWLGFKGFSGYFEKNITYQAWAAFAPQSIPFMTAGGSPTGLRGHSFAAWPGNPPQWEYIGDGTKPGYEVARMDGGRELEDLASRLVGEAPAGPAALMATPASMSLRPPASD